MQQHAPTTLAAVLILAELTDEFKNYPASFLETCESYHFSNDIANK